MVGTPIWCSIIAWARSNLWGGPTELGLLPGLKISELTMHAPSLPILSK